MTSFYSKAKMGVLRTDWLTWGACGGWFTPDGGHTDMVRIHVSGERGMVCLRLYYHQWYRMGAQAGWI